MFTIKSFNQFINEGVYDPNIFKAIFLAGGPGSGKSFVTNKIFGFTDVMKNTSMTGLKLINSDNAFELFIKKEGHDPKDLSKSEEIFKKLTVGPKSAREKAKTLTKKIATNYNISKLGTVIDGTGKNYEKINKWKNELEDIGYDCYMIFVNTSLETAKKRNTLRKRILPEDKLIKWWKDAQYNIGKFQTLFKNNFIIIDNNIIGNFEEMHNEKIKDINKFLKTPIKNRIGKEWIKRQLELKNK